jgi:hypothetical protein
VLSTLRGESPMSGGGDGGVDNFVWAAGHDGDDDLLEGQNVDYVM